MTAEEAFTGLPLETRCIVRTVYRNLAVPYAEVESETGEWYAVHLVSLNAPVVPGSVVVVSFGERVTFRVELPPIDAGSSTGSTWDGFRHERT